MEQKAVAEGDDPGGEQEESLKDESREWRASFFPDAADPHDVGYCCLACWCPPVPLYWVVEESTPFKIGPFKVRNGWVEHIIVALVFCALFYNPLLWAAGLSATEALAFGTNATTRRLSDEPRRTGTGDAGMTVGRLLQATTEMAGEFGSSGFTPTLARAALAARLQGMMPQACNGICMEMPMALEDIATSVTPGVVGLAGLGLLPPSSASSGGALSPADFARMAPLLEEVALSAMNSVCLHPSAFTCVYANAQECVATTTPHPFGDDGFAPPMGPPFSLEGLDEIIACFCNACPHTRNAVVRFVVRVLGQMAGLVPQNRTEMLAASCPVLGAEPCLAERNECFSFREQASMLTAMSPVASTPGVLAVECQVAGVSTDPSSVVIGEHLPASPPEVQPPNPPAPPPVHRGVEPPLPIAPSNDSETLAVLQGQLRASVPEACFGVCLGLDTAFLDLSQAMLPTMVATRAYHSQPQPSQAGLQGRLETFQRLASSHATASAAVLDNLCAHEEAYECIRDSADCTAETAENAGLRAAMAGPEAVLQAGSLVSAAGSPATLSQLAPCLCSACPSARNALVMYENHLTARFLESLAAQEGVASNLTALPQHANVSDVFLVGCPMIGAARCLLYSSHCAGVASKLSTMSAAAQFLADPTVLESNCEANGISTDPSLVVIPLPRVPPTTQAQAAVPPNHSNAAAGQSAAMDSAVRCPGANQFFITSAHQGPASCEDVYGPALERCPVCEPGVLQQLQGTSECVACGPADGVTEVHVVTALLPSDCHDIGQATPPMPYFYDESPVAEACAECMTSAVCFGERTTDSIDDMVSGSMVLVVPDAFHFVRNATAAEAVRAAVGIVSGVAHVSRIGLTLHEGETGGAGGTVAHISRLLQAAAPVTASYRIPTANASSASSVQRTLSYTEPATIARILNEELESHGLDATSDVRSMQVRVGDAPAPLPLSVAGASAGGSWGEFFLARLRDLVAIVYVVFVFLLFRGLRRRWKIREHPGVTIAKALCCLPCFLSQVLGHIEAMEDQLVDEPVGVSADVP